MTPSARVSAAIDILNRIIAGEPGEKVLTNWGRGNRYAGSGDRAAIRDLVFGALRCKQSYGWLGGGETGRALMIGWARATGQDCNTLFSGDKYAPEALSEAEQETHSLDDAPRGTRLDCPDWLLEKFDGALGDQADGVLAALQARAPVFLRVNTRRADLARVTELLAELDVTAQPHPLSKSALEITKNPRRVAQSAPYKDGLVELQDAGSQAVVDYLPLQDGQRVLDYCAGGGGKALAMAARTNISLLAHDTDPKRMADFPARASRAGVKVETIETDDLSGQKFDMVLCDVPCSGSGAWRRSPDAKWDLTSDRLTELCQIQAEILQKASGMVSQAGYLSYVTCSVFNQENSLQINDFLGNNPGWCLEKSRQLTPLDGGDGFFVALLKRG